MSNYDIKAYRRRTQQRAILSQPFFSLLGKANESISETSCFPCRTFFTIRYADPSNFGCWLEQQSLPAKARGPPRKNPAVAVPASGEEPAGLVAYPVPSLSRWLPLPRHVGPVMHTPSRSKSRHPTPLAPDGQPDRAALA